MSDRFAQKVLGQSLDGGMAIYISDKGRVRIRFPAHAAAYWFLDL